MYWMEGESCTLTVIRRILESSCLYAVSASSSQFIIDGFGASFRIDDESIEPLSHVCGVACPFEDIFMGIACPDLTSDRRWVAFELIGIDVRSLSLLGF